MAIEGIIDGLNEMLRSGTDEAELITEAIKALTDVEARLDKAYLEGKYDQLREDFAMLVDCEGEEEVYA